MSPTIIFHHFLEQKQNIPPDIVVFTIQTRGFDIRLLLDQ